MELLLLLSIALFAYFLFLSIFYTLFHTEKQVKRRIRRLIDDMDSETSPKKKEKKRKKILQLTRTARKMGAVFSRTNRLNECQQRLTAAGLPLNAEEYVVIRFMIMFIGGMLFYIITGSIIAVIPGLAISWYGPLWWINRKKERRIRMFNKQLPDTLNTITNSLRAGFSFPQAIKTASEESDAPMSEELAQVLRDIQWGSSMEEALDQLKKRVPSDDLELMIEAVIIQRQVGGNLATILSTIVDTIRERNRIYRQIKTLTAQGRLSGIVIGLLPLVLGVLLFLIDQVYIYTLFSHPLGIGLMIAGIISSIIGFLMIRKITTIEV